MNGDVLFMYFVPPTRRTSSSIFPTVRVDDLLGVSPTGSVPHAALGRPAIGGSTASLAAQCPEGRPVLHGAQTRRGRGALKKCVSQEFSKEGFADVYYY